MAFVLPMELAAARQKSDVRASATLSPALVLQTAQFLIPAFIISFDLQTLEITNTRTTALQTQTGDDDSSCTHLHSWKMPEFPWQARQTEKKIVCF